MAKIKLKGHETFALREGWMNKALYAVSQDSNVFSVNSGADALGVGTNMAKAIRYWMREGGFTMEPYHQGSRLTPLGKLIYQKDPYLEDLFALWIFHVNFVSQMEKASSWYLFFNKLDAEEFSRDELYQMLYQLLSAYTENGKISERSLNDDCAVLLHMYVKERLEDYDPEDKKISPFAVLGLVKKDGDRYQKKQPEKNQLSEMVVLYILQRYFNNEKQPQSGISIETLLTAENLPGRVLNLKRVAMNEYLDVLAAQKYITVNRTAGLDMIYPKTNLTPLQVVEKYYENF